MKTDARVRYTKKVLKEALLSILEQKPINRITVKEVCDKAELNRATFYSHYADCFDLLDSIENDLFREFEASMEDYSRSYDVTKLFAAIYDMIENNEDVCRVLIFDGRGTTLTRRMIDSARDFSIDYWRTVMKGASENEIEMVYLCLSNGLLSVIVNGYGRFGKDEMIRFVKAMVDSALSAYIR